MLSCDQGKEHGLTIVPLSVSIGGETWLEYEEISKEDFLERVRNGGVPTSASPSYAMTLEAYSCDEEVLHIAMADGLSGAYEVACSARLQARYPERVTVLNSTTLCIPHRAIVYRAKELLQKGLCKEKILDKLQPMMKSTTSYLIPEDFDFLRRGGRLTPMAARIAGILKVVPLMVLTEDRKRIEKRAIARTVSSAARAIIKDMFSWGVGETYYISVSHADNPARAKKVADLIQLAFPKTRVGVFELGPAFITQGGPGCVAVQFVDLAESGINPALA